MLICLPFCMVLSRPRSRLPGDLIGLYSHITLLSEVALFSVIASFFLYPNHLTRAPNLFFCMLTESSHVCTSLVICLPFCMVLSRPRSRLPVDIIACFTHITICTQWHVVLFFVMPSLPEPFLWSWKPLVCCMALSLVGVLLSYMFTFLIPPGLTQWYLLMGSLNNSLGNNQHYTMKRNTMHQVTTMLATPKNVLFSGHNHHANHRYWWPDTLNITQAPDIYTGKIFLNCLANAPLVLSTITANCSAVRYTSVGIQIVQVLMLPNDFWTFSLCQIKIKDLVVVYKQS